MTLCRSPGNWFSNFTFDSSNYKEVRQYYSEKNLKYIDQKKTNPAGILKSWKQIDILVQSYDKVIVSCYACITYHSNSHSCNTSQSRGYETIVVQLPYL